MSTFKPVQKQNFGADCTYCVPGIWQAGQVPEDLYLSVEDIQQVVPIPPLPDFPNGLFVISQDSSNPCLWEYTPALIYQYSAGPTEHSMTIANVLQQWFSSTESPPCGPDNANDYTISTPGVSGYDGTTTRWTIGPGGGPWLSCNDYNFQPVEDSYAIENKLPEGPADSVVFRLASKKWRSNCLVKFINP